MAAGDGRGDAVSLVIAYCGSLSQAARAALDACAKSLGHEGHVCYADLSTLSGDDLVLAIHKWDPWSVVAVDEASIARLREAFGDEAFAFAPDAPTEVRGYLLVAVPAFEQCLQDQQAKRVAWGRMKAAAHPGPPY